MKRKDGTGPPARWRWSAATAVMVSSLVCCAAGGRAQSEPRTTEAEDAGEKIFMENNCFVCHGQQGFGGIGPAFRNDAFLKLNDHVAGQILMGRGVMPPFGDRLDDKQIAAVASYIRNSWGNHFGEIKPEQIAQIRRELDAFRHQARETSGSAPPQPGAR